MRGERAREQTNLTTKPTHHVITMSTHDRVTTPEQCPAPGADRTAAADSEQAKSEERPQ